MHTDAPAFDFLSPDGRNLVRNLLSPLVPFDIHDYQIEGTCALANGTDLLACIPTGAGKTAYLFLPILLHTAIQGDMSIPLATRQRFLQDPVMVAVLPTNSLESEKEKELNRLGIRALAINVDTLDAARERREDLWETARTKTSIILLSPEQLVSKGFESLLEDKTFQHRLRFLDVDEIHLLDQWGETFRKAFQQIGYTRARMPDHVVLTGLTATLLRGPRMANILRFLGLKAGQYHLIHRSNIRYDLRLLIRPLTRGLGSHKFPDFDSVLVGNRRTILFCKTILLGFRLLVHLWARAPRQPDRSIRIRMYNSLNSSAFNNMTQDLMLDPNSGLQIIIATDTLAQGGNAPNISDVMLVGEVEDPDQFVQMVGRAGRDRTSVTHARGIMYVTPSAHETARAVLGEAPAKGARTLKAAAHMHHGIARLLLAPCLRREQDALYGNPSEDVPCSCRSCATNPPTPKPDQCDCSGCMQDPGDAPPEAAHTVQFIYEDPSIVIDKPKHLGASAIRLATRELVQFRWQLWRKADEVTAGHISPSLFLPDSTISSLLDSFTTLNCSSDITPIVQDLPHLWDHRDSLWSVLVDIRGYLAILGENEQVAKRSQKSVNSREDQDEAEASESDTGVEPDDRASSPLPTMGVTEAALTEGATGAASIAQAPAKSRPRARIVTSNTVPVPSHTLRLLGKSNLETPEVRVGVSDHPFVRKEGERIFIRIPLQSSKRPRRSVATCS
ncbi:P-loop containing nucleoside triphosphate hydrolase protein [Artomyces pyxidatus]|uniref:P-loop containing nucleoside triphosphate hydrolase protein n=1 Tax=Artomyces pyxidatus TaxID=48021 RepID=A0ACB8SMJ3_9AGAM|nr:P-loop containing nucleoside triphosphate hydrolase protein [Artomyces pyxidatus]